MDLPDGFRVGHWSDHQGMTGCTVVLAPEGAVAAGEVRGGGPGTRESDLLSPASNAPGVQAVAFAGGSAYGLAVGDVMAEDGSVLAGPWRDGGYVRTIDVLKEGHVIPPTTRESTTLICLMTDAKLTKTQAWLVARAASAGVGRAVQPSATAWDGDVVYCLASGAVEIEYFGVSAVAADVTAAAIRDAIRRATGVPGCPAASER